MSDQSMVHEDVVTLARDVCAGNRRALARAISLVESARLQDQDASQHLLTLIQQRPTSSQRIGFTGSPGVGKSTLLESIGLYMIEQGRRVAVLAIDPSSKQSGGSILGDKVRMPQLSQSDAAFVRPSPAKNMLGGTALRTRDAVLLCEAAGYNTVIVETVGVGQSETLVSEMVDLFVLLQLPNAGDELQGIKRGIMELADILVVTKAEVSPQATTATTAILSNAIQLLHPRYTDWSPPVIGVSALKNIGITELYNVITDFFDDQRLDTIMETRRSQSLRAFDSSLLSAVGDLLLNDVTFAAERESLRMNVINGSMQPSVAVSKAIEKFTTRFGITS